MKTESMTSKGPAGPAAGTDFPTCPMDAPLAATDLSHDAPTGPVALGRRSALGLLEEEEGP